MKISIKEYVIAIIFSISMAIILIATSEHIDDTTTEADNTQNKKVNQTQIKDLSELKKYVNVNNIPDDMKREISR